MVPKMQKSIIDEYMIKHKKAFSGISYRKPSLRSIADSTGINVARLHRILSKDFEMSVGEYELFKKAIDRLKSRPYLLKKGRSCYYEHSTKIDLQEKRYEDNR